MRIHAWYSLYWFLHSNAANCYEDTAFRELWADTFRAARALLNWNRTTGAAPDWVKDSARCDSYLCELAAQVNYNPDTETWL